MEGNMGVFEHWPVIISTVCVGAITIFIRHYYLSKSDFEKFKTKSAKDLERFKADCEKMRSICQSTTCKMIQAATSTSTEKTDALVVGARNGVVIFDLIRRELSEVKSDVSALRASFEQYLKDAEKRNGRPL